jgi:magnesium transporter
LKFENFAKDLLILKEDFCVNFKMLQDLLEQKQYFQFKKELNSIPVADIAELLDELDATNSLLLFRLLPKEIAADVFSYLSIESQIELCELINDKELSYILDDLYFDDKIDLIEEMPANVVKKILKYSNEAERKLINQFLKYPDDSAGSLMTIEFIDLKKEMTVEEAMDRIRQTAPDKETIYTCYVIDTARHLEGTVSLKKLVLEPKNKTVEQLMHDDPIYVHTLNDQEYIADVFKKYDLLALPVVDNENRLVGIITIDDVVDVIDKENTEDFHKMAAVEPLDEEYMSAKIWTLARKRMVWLLFLMVSASFTGYIIHSFESTLQATVALATFIPLLMGTAGNAGAQASTIVIRSIVLGEVEPKDFFKVIFKELKVSMLVGIILSVLNFIRVYFIERASFSLALTVSFTLVFTIVAAKIIGGILPLIAKKLKLDPAIMASPLITTIVDAISLIVYFYSAIWIMNI